ncbi:ABC transporter permease [Acidobacteriota bacterium]
MRNLVLIGICTVREAFRSRVLYLLGIFSILLVLGSVFVGLLTVGDETRVTVDMGLAGISIFGMLIIIFLGVQMVIQEVRERTIYPVLTRPLGRHVYLLGKMLGLFLTVFINAALMTVVMILVLLVGGGEVEWGILYAVFFTLFEFMILISFAVFFSTFSTPILSSVLTLCIYLIGHLSWGLNEFASNPRFATAPIRFIARLFYYILPNLEYLNIRNEVIHGWEPGLRYVMSAAAYGMVYAAFITALSVLIFRRKDIQ